MIRVRIYKLNDRRRASMHINKRLIGEWWLESASGVAYMPLKPAPPNVSLVINKCLNRDMLEKLVMFLLITEEGEMKFKCVWVEQNVW